MGHTLKGKSEDGADVETDAEFEKKQPLLGSTVHKMSMTVPVGILRKGAVKSQVHGHGLAVGHVGDEVGGAIYGRSHSVRGRRECR